MAAPDLRRTRRESRERKRSDIRLMEYADACPSGAALLQPCATTALLVGVLRDVHQLITNHTRDRVNRQETGHGGLRFLSSR
jgi:hypothetical protein